jgi:hypothetical protein
MEDAQSCDRDKVARDFWRHQRSRRAPVLLVSHLTCVLRGGRTVAENTRKVPRGRLTIAGSAFAEYVIEAF